MLNAGAILGKMLHFLNVYHTLIHVVYVYNICSFLYCSRVRIQQMLYLRAVIWEGTPSVVSTGTVCQNLMSGLKFHDIILRIEG